MQKKSILGSIMAVVLSLLLVASAIAGVANNDKNGWQVNGKHYNLNIIGAKTSKDVGESNGHTMFVKLNGKTKIVMTQDPEGDFYVTDRDGTDGLAEFNIAPGYYNVYSVARGKPNGNADVNAWGEFEDAVEGTKLEHLGYVNLARSRGKPQSVNINELFYVDVTICVEEGGETVCYEYEDTWVFDIDELLEYYWDYDNDGLKQLQVRFYECTLDATGQANDFCRWGDGTPIDSKKTIVS